MDETTNGGWLEEAMAVNAIALAWYHVFTQQTPSPTVTSQPTASVHTPMGGASLTISPVVLLMGAGLIVWLIVR